MKRSSLSLSIILVSALASLSGHSLAAEPAPQQTPAADASDTDTAAEKVNVNAIKEKYWARGDQSEMGVVQNRTYTKDGKWELGLLGGVVMNDPFLNVNNLGFTLGYHFTEYFSVNALAWKAYASGSSALTTFTQTEGATTNYNKPQAYYGGEAVGSILYGKLSLLGQSIIYYDMHILGGFGLTNTQNGTYPTPHIGLGEQIYLNKFLSLRLDYRLMYYHEQIKERVISTELGDVVGSRNNFSNVITLGFSVMFGGSRK